MFSCNSDNPNYTWNLENETLRESILNYIESVNAPSVKEKFVQITYQYVNDSTIVYTLGYCINS